MIYATSIRCNVRSICHPICGKGVPRRSGYQIAHPSPNGVPTQVHVVWETVRVARCLADAVRLGEVDGFEEVALCDER